MSITSHLESLHIDDEGIWISNSCSKINYPEDGNAHCFLIEDKSYWFQHRNDCIISMIKKYPPSGTILDVGGGNGFVSKRIISEGFKSVVLEPGRVGAKNAKHLRGIPDVINTTFEDAKFSENSLSAVGLFDVLEHIEEDRDFIMQIWHTLKTHGYIYLTVPAFNFMWSYSDNHAEHYRRYNLKMMRTLIQENFTLLYYTFFFSLLFLPTIMFRVIPYRMLPKRNRNIIQSANEHGANGGPLIKILSSLFKMELQLIHSGKHLPFGTSCLFVLMKN